MGEVNCQVDMHIHTSASDGTWTGEELLERIIEKDIKVFSITDHDIIKNSLKIINSIPNDIYYVIGAEISCTYNDQEYHITAYDFDYKNVELQELLKFNMLQRNENNTAIIQYLKRINRLVDIEDYFTYEPEGSRGGWKSLNYLLDKNIIEDMAGYFEIMKRSNERLCFKEPKDVIDIINAAGGCSFLAHPSAYKKGEKLPLKVLEEWKDYGISGIECYSPYLDNMEDAKYYVRFCNENNLMNSAGSDCHGEFNNRTLGIPKGTMNDVRLDFINNRRS